MEQINTISLLIKTNGLYMCATYFRKIDILNNYAIAPNIANILVSFSAFSCVFFKKTFCNDMVCNSFKYALIFLHIVLHLYDIYLYA